LEQLDRFIAAHRSVGSPPIDLFILGRSALILRFGLNSATKDLDIVLGCLPADLEALVEERFGRGSKHAETAGLYVETVSSGLPPLPNDYRGRSEEISGDWRSLRPLVLNPVHIAVSKLSRFHAKDRQDIQYLADRGELDRDALRDALHRAFLFTEDGDSKRDAAYANLARVEAYLSGLAAGI
jgi:hypothetical protein